MASLKRIIKTITPPVIWKALADMRGSRTFRPEWVTLTRGPAAGMKMYMDPAGNWQRKIIEGSYDAFLFDRIAALKPEGKTIYDIGSHVGYHALACAALAGPGGTVVAFEPNKANFDRILKHCAANPGAATVRPFNIAASDSVGSVSFTTNNEVEGGRSTGGFIAGSATHEERGYYDRKGFSTVTVEALPLDLAPDKLGIPLPSIIKIDVEGAEALVLTGARSLIARARPVIFVEIHSIKAMNDVRDLFQTLNYTTVVINVEPNGVTYLEARPRA